MHFIQRSQQTMTAIHQRRSTAGVSIQLALALGGAVFTGLMSQAVIYLPWTPVPVTGQSLAVLLTGLLLGPWGGVSQALYAALGLAGVPWFAGAKGGVSVLAGPTAGYLLGFIVAAWVVGSVMEHWPRMRRFHWMLLVLTLVNIVLIFAPGLAGLALWMNAVTGDVPSLHQLLVMGFYPFVPGAIVKTLMAAALGRALLPIVDERRGAGASPKGL